MRGESRCNKIAKRFEETNKVKRRIYFVKRRILQGAISNWQLAKPSGRRSALINADQKQFAANERENTRIYLLVFVSRASRVAVREKPSGAKAQFLNSDIAGINACSTP